MCMKISEATSYLENAFDILNEKLFESTLTRPIITIQSTPRFYGHFTPYDSWFSGENGYKEINIGAESLNRPIVETVATLIHEMTHYYCHINGIKDTSRNGRYHNKVFKLEAEKRLISIAYDKRIGFSVTTPTPQLESFVAENGLLIDVDISRNTPINASGKRPTSTRKYICPQCGTSVRATKVVNIKCADCDEIMVTI